MTGRWGSGGSPSEFEWGNTGIFLTEKDGWIVVCRDERPVKEAFTPERLVEEYRRVMERAEVAEERASQLERDLEVAQSMDMTATANQWEAACKQARREAAEWKREAELSKWPKEAAQEYHRLKVDYPQARLEAKDLQEQLDQLREALHAVSNAYGCFAGCTGALPGAPEDGSGHTVVCRFARAALAGVKAKEQHPAKRRQEQEGTWTQSQG